MTDEERYPETSEDEEMGPLDPIVDVLREADVSHKEKAIACLAAARTEFSHAVDDGEIGEGWEHWEAMDATTAFLGWAQETLPMLDDVLERVHG